jgi:hypothetical protein
LRAVYGRLHVQALKVAIILAALGPPAEDWQAEASRVAAYAENTLRSLRGHRAMRYLKQRGLTEETILRARLGLIPGRSQEWLRLGRLVVPCGISISWFVGRELWAVKVRSAAGTLNPHWLPLLLYCRTILVADDADEAGMKGAARLQAQTHRAQVIQVPWGRDVTEFVLQGESVVVR